MPASCHTRLIAFSFFWFLFNLTWEQGCLSSQTQATPLQFLLSATSANCRLPLPLNNTIHNSRSALRWGFYLPITHSLLNLCYLASASLAINTEFLKKNPHHRHPVPTTGPGGSMWHALTTAF